MGSGGGGASGGEVQQVGRDVPVFILFLNVRAEWRCPWLGPGMLEEEGEQWR